MGSTQGHFARIFKTLMTKAVGLHVQLTYFFFKRSDLKSPQAYEKLTVYIFFFSKDSQNGNAHVLGKPHPDTYLEGVNICQM
jgi:hypothetical protein